METQEEQTNGMPEQDTQQEQVVAKKAPTGHFWRSFARKKFGMLGLFMLVSMILIAIFAPWIAPYDP